MIGIFVNLWNRISGSVSYLLDQFSGAAAAYSLRKLSTTYGGSAIRVRRASDNTEQDIGFVGQDLDEPSLMNFVGYQNLLQRSEEFNDAYWFNFNTSITANAASGPNNTTTADKIIEGSGSNIKYLYTNLGVSVSANTYTGSVYAKAGERSRLVMGIWGGTDYQLVQFDLSNGTIVQEAAAGIASISSVGNDWYRCTVTRTIGSLTTYLSFGPHINSSIGTLTGAFPSYTGDGSSGVFIWGAQLNAGTTAQPYQVTTSAARSGDGFVTKWYTQDSNGENLLLQSQTFENASWRKTQISVSANSTIDPIGGSTGDTIFETAANDIHYIDQINAYSAGTYTFSVYLKYLNRKYVLLGLSDNVANGAGVVFDVELGSYVGNSVTGTSYFVQSYSISPQAGGWYRYSVTVLTSGLPKTDVQLRNSNTLIWGNSYAGSTSVGIYIWGAQLSQGSWLQPYQATTTAAILRRDASQSTAANQPRIVGGGVIERENGKAAIDHTSAQSLSIPSAINFGTTYTFLAAFKHDVAGREVFGSSNSYGLYQDSSGTYHSANSFGGTSSGYGLNYNLLSVYRNGTTAVNILRNAIQYGSQFNLASNNIFTFNNISGEGPSANLDGRISEGVLYPTSLVATLPDINRNIGAYYQTQWTGASTGLLDQFGGAAAAYSLRNLSSSYRGPLIRVRRSSDNAETDIGGTYNGDLDVASLLSFTGGQNLVLQSEDFSSASWAKVNSTVTANSTIAPDGNLTADKLTETAINGQHVVNQSFTISASSTYTFSFYAKAAERSKIYAVPYINTGVFDSYFSYFDLSNGTVYQNATLGSATLISSSIQSVGNGWYRCSVTGNTNKTGSHNVQIEILNDSWQRAYLGVAGSGVYIWGAQLNTGILQPYIPTTTAAVNGANAFVTKWYTQDNNYQNLVLQSQTFENASWLKTNVSVTQDVTIAPDGSSTADKLVSTGLNGFIYQNSASFPAFGNNSASINLNDGTVSAIIAGSFDTIGTTNVGNGWWRIYASKLGYTFSCYAKKADWDYTVIQLYTLTGNNGAYIYPANAPNAPLGNGGGTQGIFIWGAQVNEGSVAQPYTATTTTVSQRRDAIQATAASQPRIVNAGGVESEGNRPALFFDGTDDALTTSNAVITSNNFSTFAAFAVNATSAMNIIVQHDGAIVPNRTILIGSPSTSLGSAYIAYNDGTTGYSAITSSTQPFDGTGSIVYSDTNGSGLSTIGFNGVQGGSVNGTVWIPLNAPLRMGSVNGATSFLLGRVSETFIYNSRQTNPQTISSNINSYYQIYWQGNGTALLDNYSGASAAYSLRNLSSAYTGPLIRVRRSNDNVERDIYGTFGGDLDIASLVAFVGANSAFVTTWYDQSGSGRHAVQTTAGNQPRIVNAGVVDTQNGKPALSFSTIQDLSIGTPLNYEGINSSFFMTMRRDTAGNDSILIDSTGNRYLWLNYGATQYYGSATIIDSDFATANQYMIAAATMDYGVSLKWYKNGNLEQNKTTGFSLGQAFNTILYRLYRASVIQTSELIVYPSNVESSAVQIQSNINNYYKIY